ncbi:hypothetical protein Btru_001542 [Bulinus truncatus]|nr:hypothetical protein Btru_001542 [Bulinus truncatus]
MLRVTAKLCTLLWIKLDLYIITSVVHGASTLASCVTVFFSKIQMACRKYLVMKITTLVGLFLKTLTTGVSWYWGNMSVYADSYYRATLGPDSGFGTPWVMSTFIIGFAVGLLVTQKMASLIGRAWTNVVSFLLFELGVLLSYFAINSSVGAMVGTIGAIAGVGSGITEGQLLYYVLAWSDKHVGLISALVSSAYSGGSIMINQLVTLYVNPTNETPNLRDGNKVFFDQTAILDRVPSMFLVLGAASFLAQFAGILLIRDNPFREKTKEVMIDKTDKDSSTTSTPVENSSADASADEIRPIMRASRHEGGHFPQNYSGGTAVRRLSNESFAGGEMVGERTCPRSTFGQVIGGDMELVNMGAVRANNELCEVVSEGGAEAVTTNDAGSPDKSPGGATGDVSPAHLFRAPSFYALWVSTVATDYSYIIITNYYKTYGQVRIKDDHFLTSVAMVTSVASTISEIFWGASLDRFKIKHCLMVYLGAQAVVGAYWYFTAMAGKYLYMVCTIVLGCMNAGMYEVFFVGTLKYFGAAHFSMNYGIVYSGSVVINLAAPPFIDFILNSFGWFHLFMSFSVLNTLALLLIVFTLPYK